MPNFYSQHGEDKWIEENLKPPASGVFVDVGASDGVSDSNTKHFEQISWSGVCFEPDPRIFGWLVYNRLCHTLLRAVSATPGIPKPFKLTPHSPHCGFLSEGQSIYIPQVRLDTELGKLNIDHIDLLSIDTEGTELDVWNSFDHNIWKPQIVIIEWETQGRINNRQNYLEAFAELPYDLVHETKGNFIFKRR